MNKFLLGMAVLLGIFCLSKVECRARKKRDFPEIKEVLDAHNNLRKVEKSSNMKKMVKLRFLYLMHLKVTPKSIQPEMGPLTSSDGRQLGQRLLLQAWSAFFTHLELRCSRSEPVYQQFH